jgi:hypothetical protein
MIRRIAIALSGLVIALPVYAQMSDRQYEDLRDIDQLCFRRQHWVHGATAYERGFERCKDIEEAFITEYDRRQKASVAEDQESIGIYFQMYPPSGKLSLGGKR